MKLSLFPPPDRPSNVCSACCSSCTTVLNPSVLFLKTIVQKNGEYEDGDAVVAVIDGCATVKNIKKDNEMVILYPQSSNPIHKPIYLDANGDSMINGKVIKVLPS